MRERCGSMKLAVYEHVLALNAGFEQVRRALSALGRCRGLDRSELQRFSDEAKRIRAAAMSHMASVIEAAETDEAGQRFRKNVARERKEQ